MEKFQHVLLFTLAFFISGCCTMAITKDMQLSNQSLEHIINQDYAKAESDLNEALEVNPNNPYAVLNMGVVYQNTNRSDKAKAMYEKVIKLNPEETASKSNLDKFRGKSLVDIAKENLKTLQ